MKKHLGILVFTFALLFALPGTAMAADANDDGYHDGDVAVINKMIDSNGLMLTKDDPANWGGHVTWDDGTEKRIIRLDVNYQPLTGSLDVSGLTNLAYLDCGSTNITALKVSGLTNLENLKCDITKITELDLADLTSLTELACSATDISELDVSHLTNLTKLACNSTDITQLDVSGLTNLAELNCAITGITELNIAHLTNLTKLECGNTNITVLDVSNLTSLRELECINTDITVLDVANLTNLTSLACAMTDIAVLNVTNLTNLTNLVCGQTDITELDVANLTNLTNLDCDQTGITELDVANLANLTKLECGKTGITELDVANLFNLTELTCHASDITELDVSNLINLTRFSCTNTGITKLDLTGLAKLSYLNVLHNEYTSFTNPAGQALTVRKAGDGTGKVVMTAYNLDSGSITLQATADEGSGFIGWTVQPKGATVNGSEISFTLNADMTVEATFGNACPRIATESLPGCTVGAPYPEATLEASGNTPITWALSDGSLPAGLTLGSDGVIRGTPTEAGIFTFTVKASNNAGSDAKELRISAVQPGDVNLNGRIELSDTVLAARLAVGVNIVSNDETLSRLAADVSGEGGERDGAVSVEDVLYICRILLGQPGPLH